MIRRYAAHFLYIADVGFIRRQVVEIANGNVQRLLPLTGELENTVWIADGIIALWPPAVVGGDGWRSEFVGEISHSIKPSLPVGWQHGPLSSLQAYSLTPFDLIALKPVAGTRHILLL